MKGVAHVPEVFSSFHQDEVEGISLPEAALGLAAAAAVVPAPGQVLAMVHGIITSMLGPEVCANVSSLLMQQAGKDQCCSDHEQD